MTCHIVSIVVLFVTNQAIITVIFTSVTIMINWVVLKKKMSVME